jgi:hypothetical protein
MAAKKVLSERAATLIEQESGFRSHERDQGSGKTPYDPNIGKIPKS